MVCWTAMPIASILPGVASCWVLCVLKKQTEGQDWNTWASKSISFDAELAHSPTGLEMFQILLRMLFQVQSKTCLSLCLACSVDSSAWGWSFCSGAPVDGPIFWPRKPTTAMILCQKIINKLEGLHRPSSFRYVKYGHRTCETSLVARCLTWNTQEGFATGDEHKLRPLLLRLAQAAPPLLILQESLPGFQHWWHSQIIGLIVILLTLPGHWFAKVCKNLFLFSWIWTSGWPDQIPQWSRPSPLSSYQHQRGEVS